jgi:hypothetical protein
MYAHTARLACRGSHHLSILFAAPFQRLHQNMVSLQPAGFVMASLQPAGFVMASLQPAGFVMASLRRPASWVRGERVRVDYWTRWLGMKVYCAAQHQTVKHVPHIVLLYHAAPIGRRAMVQRTSHVAKKGVCSSTRRVCHVWI